MSILPFTKSPVEHDKGPQDATSLAELFNLFPKRLEFEPADISKTVEAMQGVVMSKHVKSWADNSNLLGAIGDVYSMPDAGVAEIVEGMSTDSVDDLGLRTFSPSRNDDYLTRITEQDEVQTDDDAEFLGVNDVQAQMAREARMIIDRSFDSATNENFALVS